MPEFNLLQNRVSGFDCHGYNKHGKFVSTKKFHYYKNGRSLCGKYFTNSTSLLPKGSVMTHEICRECLRKLKSS